MHRNLQLSLLAIATLAAPFSTFAADAYEATRSYEGGAIVEFKGSDYRAKWWVNPGQSPANVDTVANPWETPWERLSSGGGNIPPTVALTSPANGSQIEAGSVIRMTADASDKDGGIARVDFYIDDQHSGGVVAPPYALDLMSPSIGTHHFKAVATDTAGAKTTSATAIVQVIIPGDIGLPGDTYSSTQGYGAGCVVIFKGEHFRAKWFANPGQSPASVDTVAQPWETPWERTQPTALGCKGGEPEPGNPDPGTPDPGKPDPGKPDPGAIKLRLSELNAKEAALTDFPEMKSVKESIRTLDNTQVLQVVPGREKNPDNVRRVESILDSANFEFVFPMRAPEYTYTGLLQSIAKFPAVCRTYEDGRDSDAICRKTLATMVAHFAQETGGHESWRDVPEWRQALVHVREMGWNEHMRGGYNGECNPATWQGQAWPCGTFEDGQFKSYFGRGAKQLSYNYNYGPFSEAMFGTVRTLLDDPAQVADTWLNLASAVFFYAYPQPPKPSMLHVIDGTWKPNARDLENGLVSGFGVTTQIINGGVECGGPSENAQSVNRMAYYKAAAEHFKVPVAADEVLGCKGMKQFDEGGAGALPVFWENDWSWDAANADGRSLSCKLVGYQTAFSAFKNGDYALCVAAHNGDVEIIDDTH